MVINEAITKFIGTLAVEKGWLKESQIDDIATESQLKNLPFGQVLIEREILSKDQLNFILQIQRESETKQEDYLFGQLAVSNRLLKAEQILDVLKMQKENESNVTLGQLLIEHKLLTEQQCNAVAKAQSRILSAVNQDRAKKKKIFCPKCNKQFILSDPDRFRKVKCNKCKYIFETGEKEFRFDTDEIPKNQDSTDYGLDASKSLHEFMATNKINTNVQLDKGHEKQIKEGNARYIVGKEIARGGMGAILSTRDTNLRREIVTKVLIKRTSHLATVRFIEEAQITGQLEHPNIPPVYDLGVNKYNQLYFTMKHIKGETLESIILQLKANSPEYVSYYNYKNLINIFLKVLNALSYAHSKRVLHRDIKPENIMVGDFGEVLLMDWGLAKIIGTKEEFEELEDQEISTIRSDDVSSNTLEGTTAGTPTFMSPEQAAGYMDDLDQRSDIYSLGATLFNAISLERPIKGKSIQDVLIKAANGEIEHLPNQIPKELKAITLKAMAFDVGERYQSLEEFEDDLLKYQQGYSVSAKQDSALDLISKFYKRNTLVTIISATSLFVIILSTIFFTLQVNKQYNEAVKAKRIAEENLLKFNDAQTQRDKDNKEAAPTYFQTAQDEASIGNFEKAYRFASTAYNFGKNKEYLELKALLALHLNKLTEARSYFQECINSQYSSYKCKTYLEFIDKYLNKPASPQYISDLIALDELNQENQFASHLENDINKKLKLWGKELSKYFNGYNFTLSLDEDNLVTFKTSYRSIEDYSILSNFPIQSLVFENTNLNSIEFIKKMPLKKFKVYLCSQLINFEPLQSKDLISLELYLYKPIEIQNYIKHMKLKKLACHNAIIKDINTLSNMPLQYLSAANQEWDSFDKIAKLPLIEFEYRLSTISSLEPFSQCKTLQKMVLRYCQVVSLKGLEKTNINTFYTHQLSVPILEHLNPETIEYIGMLQCKQENFELLKKFKKLKEIQFTPSKVSNNWKQVLKEMEKQLSKISFSNRPKDYGINLETFLINYENAPKDLK